MTELQRAQSDVVSLRDVRPAEFKPVFLPQHQGTLIEAVHEEDPAQLSMWGPRQLELTFDER